MFGNNKNWFKAYIVDVLPCISVAFYVLAFIYTDAFYTVFGIDIVKYTTFGDVFMSITSPMVVFALFVAIMLPMYHEMFTMNLISTFKVIDSKKFWHLLPFGIKFYLLRKFSKIKKTRFGKFLIGKFLKAKENGNNSKTDDLLVTFAFVMLLFVYLGYSFTISISTGAIKPTLLSCALALILPILFLSIVFYFLIVIDYTINKRRAMNLVPKGGRLVIFGIGYYIYAISMFNIIGHQEGLNMRENNQIKFEIVTSRGEVYDNTKFGYIGHLSEQTFLFERSSKENIILNNESIISTKIIDNMYEEKSFTFMLYFVYEETLKKVEPLIMKMIK